MSPKDIEQLGEKSTGRIHRSQPNRLHMVVHGATCKPKNNGSGWSLFACYSGRGKGVTVVVESQQPLRNSPGHDIQAANIPTHGRFSDGSRSIPTLLKAYSKLIESQCTIGENAWLPVCMYWCNKCIGATPITFSCSRQVWPANPDFISNHHICTVNTKTNEVVYSTLWGNKNLDKFGAHFWCYSCGKAQVPLWPT